MKKVKLFKEPLGKLRYLSWDEIRKLMEACKEDDLLRPIITLALHTGMRETEILL